MHITTIKRRISALVLLTFTSLTLQPLQAVAQWKLEQAKATQAAAPSDDEHYAKLLDDIKETAKKGADKASKGQSARDDAKTLRQQKKQLDALETRVDDEFAATETDLIAKHLPAEILARHRAAVADYKTKQTEFKQKLKALESADDQDNESTRASGINSLSTWLEQNQKGKTHTKTDPNKLPFRAPDSKVRAPIESESGYKGKLSLFGIKPLHLAGPIPAGLTLPQAVDPAAPPTAADLAATEDIQLTPAIRAQAAALNHNPVQIHNWVRNTIEYLPTYGSIQGADMTLQTKRGNAFDTASLEIALMRAAGIPTRYVYGTIQVPANQAMNWVGGVTKPEAAQNLLGQGGIPNIGLVSGGVISAIKMEHVWVEAYVDYIPSRGAVNKTPDTWVPLDASFKQYTYTQGMDIKGAVPLDANSLLTQAQAGATVNEAEGWVQNLNGANIQNALTSYQSQVKSYIDATKPNATVGDVLGGKSIQQKNYSILLGTLPYKTLAVGSRMASLPDSLRHKFQYNLYASDLDRSLDSPTIAHTVSLPNLAGKKITLSFVPASQADADLIASYLPKPHADGSPIQPSELPTSLPGYLIRLTAELRVDGLVVASGGNFTMGQELTSNMGLFDPASGWDFGEDNKPIAGEYIATYVDLQGISSTQVQAVNDRLAAFKTKLDANQFDVLRPGDLTGDSLYCVLLAYFLTNWVEGQISSRADEIVDYRKPSFGSFMVAAQPKFWFGVPKSVSFPGLVMDVDRYTSMVVAKDNDPVKQWAYLQHSSMRLSAYEHIIPERIFSAQNAPVQGVSAMKALAIAASQGQKIYTLTGENSGLILPQLAILASVKQEIENAVAAGKQVTVHRSNIALGGWTGVGYIILDPETGSGAYKISGGYNGGVLNFAVGVAQQPALLLPPCGASFLETMINNFLTTNAAIPGIAFPAGAGLLTASVVSDAVGGQTFLTAIKLTIKNPTFLLGNLRAALIVSIINFLIMSIVFEFGIFVGSAIGAAFCRKD